MEKDNVRFNLVDLVKNIIYALQLIINYDLSLLREYICTILKMHPHRKYTPLS